MSEYQFHEFQAIDRLQPLFYFLVGNDSRPLNRVWVRILTVRVFFLVNHEVEKRPKTIAT
jgi:hypothetical protein